MCTQRRQARCPPGDNIQAPESRHPHGTRKPSTASMREVGAVMLVTFCSPAGVQNR